MNPLQAMAATLRSRPGHDDRLARLARKQGYRSPSEVPADKVDAYYLTAANRIAGGWLASLNDEELELRLEFDQRVLVVCDETQRAEFELDERLELTLKEMGRRGGLTAEQRRERDRAKRNNANPLVNVQVGSKR